MSEVPPHPPSKSGLTDIDLYCLHCGYNLRGLFGDPRRCPECGHLNPVGDLELPAEAITAQLRRMETNPAVCAGMVLVCAIFSIPFILALVLTPPGTPLSDFGCFLIPTVISVGIWVLCAFGFRRSCRAQSGWVGALWRYHVYALMLCAMVGIVGIVPAVAFFWSDTRVGGRNFGFFVGAVILAVSLALVLIGTVGKRVHGELKAILQPFQREMAVNLAREILRRRLTLGRFW